MLMEVIILISNGSVSTIIWSCFCFKQFHLFGLLSTAGVLSNELKWFTLYYLYRKLFTQLDAVNSCLKFQSILNYRFISRIVYYLRYLYTVFLFFYFNFNKKYGLHYAFTYCGLSSVFKLTCRFCVFCEFRLKFCSPKVSP